MADGYRMDFALLEETFLQRLQQGRLQRFTGTLRALLVDEYQDTNPLQERIYFTIIQQTAASFTIVGDDDQSLYRFRGATVELFRDFQQRFAQQVPQQPPPQSEYLVANYRSTPTIVGYFNTFIQNCTNFQAARVQPPKPQIVAQRPANGVPVLGMFRPNANTLADDLTSFLWDVFRGNGRTINVGGNPVTITETQMGAISVTPFSCPTPSTSLPHNSAPLPHGSDCRGSYERGCVYGALTFSTPVDVCSATSLSFNISWAQFWSASTATGYCKAI